MKIPILANLTNVQRLWIIGFLCHLIIPFFSTGFHHPDEYFQIIEFANFKLGSTPASHLAWEFEAQIRGGLMPYMAYIVIKMLQSTGLSSPFTAMLVLRIASAQLGFWSAYIFYKTIKYIYLPQPQQQLIYSFIANLFWLLPYMHTRFSSDSLGSSFLLLGLVYIIKSEKNKMIGNAIVAGLFLGLGFVCRFQLITGFLGLFLGFVLYQNNIIRRGISIIIGFVIVNSVSIVTDYWLYGKWLCWQSNYLTKNVGEGIASQFGTMPFYGYLQLSIIQIVPPISLLLIIVSVIGMWVHRKHFIPLLIATFIVLHSCIAHKESRFLFPILSFVPLYFTLGYIYIYAPKNIHYK